MRVTRTAPKADAGRLLGGAVALLQEPEADILSIIYSLYDGGFYLRVVTTMGLAVLLLLGASIAGYGQDMSVWVKVVRTASGPVPGDAKGMTLYIYDTDTKSGESVCNGPCAQNWPPVVAEADAKPEGDFTVNTRDDGSKQWAYKGKPLYKWVKDTKPGDITGDGFKNVWHVVKF